MAVSRFWGTLPTHAGRLIAARRRLCARSELHAAGRGLGPSSLLLRVCLRLAVRAVSCVPTCVLAAVPAAVRGACTVPVSTRVYVCLRLCLTLCSYGC